MNRELFPDAAFASVLEIGGETYKIFRHHTDEVKDGTEHDTVDPRLLAMALRMIDQVPGTDEERKAIKEHLEAHASALRKTLEDERAAKETVEANSGGPSGNDNITDPRQDMTMEPAESDTISRKGEAGQTQAATENPLVDKKVGGSIVGGGSTPTKPGEKDTDAGKPDKLDDTDRDLAPKTDVEVKEGKPAPSDKPKPSETDEGVAGGIPADDEKVVGNPGDVQKGTKAASTPTKPGTEPKGKPGVDTNEDQNIAPKTDVEKGKKGKAAENPMARKGDGKSATEPKKDKEEKKADPKVEKEADKDVAPKGAKAEKKYKKDKSEKDKAECTDDMDKDDKDPKADKEGDDKDVPPGKDKKKGKSEKKKLSKAGVGDWVRNKQGFVGVVTSISDAGKPVIRIPAGHDQAIESKGWEVVVKANEVNVVDSEDLLQKEMRILNSPEALVRFATPTAEGQRARNPVVALASVQDLTPAGREFLQQRFMDAIQGKAVAKIIGIEKFGSVDYVDVKMGDEKEFPFTMMLDVARDSEGKVVRIRMLNSDLPVEVFGDFAKFLRDLSKEAPVKKTEASADELRLAENAIKKAEAPAKLDRCVADVLTKKVAEFKKKNGRAPTKDERADMESSAFAICQAQIKKG